MNGAHPSDWLLVESLPDLWDLLPLIESRLSNLRIVLDFLVMRPMLLGEGKLMVPVKSRAQVI